MRDKIDRIKVITELSTYCDSIPDMLTNYGVVQWNGYDRFDLKKRLFNIGHVKGWTPTKNDLIFWNEIYPSLLKVKTLPRPADSVVWTTIFRKIEQLKNIKENE